MKLNVIHMHETLLHSKTLDIPLDQIQSPSVQDHIQQMLDIYQTLPAVGLAAPQVGWNARVFLIGIEDEHSRQDEQGLPLTVYINPSYEIIDDSRELDWEGCFSVFNQPNQEMLGQVQRYKAICFHAYDRDGKPFSGQYDGFRARVFQHEYDHLDGLRYVNRMKNNNQLHFKQDDKSHNVYMHQVPKALRSKKYPVLHQLIPMLEKAPSNQINRKLLDEIIKTHYALSPG